MLGDELDEVDEGSGMIDSRIVNNFCVIAFHPHTTSGVSICVDTA